MSVNIQSNAQRGDYMRGIVDRTIKEIHDDVVTVFGPYATDAYLTKNGLPYYTRDGLETVGSMRFDNELSNYVLQIMYQAIDRQGKKVGDGTTTLAVLYTNLYKAIREWVTEEDQPAIPRDMWDFTIKALNARLKNKAVPMTDDDLRAVLYTCTQDHQLAAKIDSELHNAIMNHAFIMISKADSDTEFSTTVHNSPVFKATRQFTIRPVPDHVDDAVILYCNGILDIAHPTVITNLMQVMNSRDGVEIPRHIILLCHGTTEATRRSCKDVVALLQGSTPEQLAGLNNIAIYTLTEYRKYDSEQLEDIATILTDFNGIGGLVNPLTFESLLYQTINGMMPEEMRTNIPELSTFDHDMEVMQRLREMLSYDYAVDVDAIEGLRIYKRLGPIAKARYDQLLKNLDEEKSEVKKVAIRRRLRTMYGEFIDVEVGSKLIKDSQRKYELILDAILSSSEGVEHGVLKANSILMALQEVVHYYEELNNNVGELPSMYDHVKATLNILETALINTVYDMAMNGWNLAEEYQPDEQGLFNLKAWETWLCGVPEDRTALERFDLHRENWNDVLPRQSGGYVPGFSAIELEDGTRVDIPNQITEPVSIITTLLEHSTIMLELAMAKTFHLDGFNQNYI